MSRSIELRTRSRSLDSARSSNGYGPVPNIDEDNDLDPFELNDNDFVLGDEEEEGDSFITSRGKFPQKLLNFGRGRKVSQPHETTPKNGICGTVFLLLNTMIGSGILNQPQVFSESGLVGGATLYLICCATVWVAQQKLLQAGLKTGVMDYGKLAHECYGRAGSWTLDGMMVLGGFMAQCSYLTVIAGETVAVLETVMGNDMKVITEVHVLPVVTVAIVLPLCMTRHFGHLACISVISITSMALVIGCVIFAGPHEGRLQGYANDPLLLFSLPGVVQKVGAMLYGVNSMSSTFFAYQSMEVRTPERWRSVTSITMLVGATMCLVTGIGGYLAFRSGTDGDILDMFTGASVFVAVKVMVIFHLILYLPVSFLVSRHSFSLLVFKQDVLDMSFCPYFILTTSLLGGPFLVVMTLFFLNMSEGDAFGYILDITGSLCVGCIALTLPGLIYLKVVWRSKKSLTKVGIYFLIFGIILNFLVPTVNVLKRMEQ
mmetsp:Transcript_38002/g.48448  ORF Transcript_38002/g.48448 Transcript_38002/m.48448 type:complete len:487 (+) Transcript_38002:206-1666(+)